MKYTIILGFSIAILPVFVIAEGDSEVGECAKIPDRLTEAMKNCLNAVVYGEDIVKSFMNDDESMSKGAKHIALCMVTDMGQFKDGKFDVEFIEEQLKEELGSHSKLDVLLEFTLASAQKANAAGGSDIEKAFVFTILQRAKEIMDVVREVYCIGGK